MTYVFDRSKDRRIAKVFVDAQPGEHTERTQQRAIAEGCDFFVHNDRVYAVTGDYWADAPTVSARYLRGELDIYETRRHDFALAQNGARDGV